MLPGPSQPRDWPQTLPDLAFSAKSLTEDYGLAATMPGFSTNTSLPYAQELPHIKAFFMEGVHMARGLEYPNPVKLVTCEGALDTVQGFLGFMAKVGDPGDHGDAAVHPADVRC